MSVSEGIMPTDSIEALQRTMETILARLGSLEAKVVALTTLQEREAQLCPYRGTVERNTTRLGELEKTVTEMRLEMARMSILSGTAGGGVVSLIGGVLLAVGKSLGWW